MSRAHYQPFRMAEILRTKGSVGAFSAAAHEVHHVVRWRPVDYLEIMAVTAGVGRKTEMLGPGRREAVRIARGDVFLVRNGGENVIEPLVGSPLSLIIVSFAASDWLTLAGLIGVDPEWSRRARPPKATIREEDRDAHRAFTTVLARSRAGLSRLELVRFLVTVIPLLLPVHDPRNSRADAPRWLSSALESMAEEANLRGGVPRLQALAHVSPQYLSTSVRRYHGTTPSRLVAEMRLRHAAMLLVTTRESVATVAARCGYRTPEYFATCFKREHHVSPRRYRTRFTEM